MIALFMSIIMAAPGSALKTGGLPPMLLNPDTVVTETSGGLPSNLGSVMDNVVNLPGAVFGLGVIDLDSGERLTRNERRRFYMDTPDIVAAAYSVSRHNSGEFRLDSLVRHNTQIWMMFRDGQQGSRERLLAAIIHCGNMEPLQAWLSAGYPNTEFNGVARDWEGAPESDPNYTNVSDCLDFIEIVSDNLDITAVRRMTSSPPLSVELEALLGTSNVVYGWTSGRGDTRCINLIISRPDGARYGITVLANDLCCAPKADMGFSLIWNAL
ncbi:MAG: hypothetical protein KAR40_02745 [Candidatus Sabulitectum sp.]|nr:hypothetical protein [Candidatus Sabulitectum sp.]